MKAGLVVACLLALATGSSAISFRLEPEVRKCVKEEVHKDVLVVGEYRLAEMDGQRTDLVVGVGLCSGECEGDVVRVRVSDAEVPNNAHLSVCPVCRWQIPEATHCSVKSQPLKEDLLSLQKAMKCLRSAFTPLSQVSGIYTSWKLSKVKTFVIMPPSAKVLSVNFCVIGPSPYF